MKKGSFVKAVLPLQYGEQAKPAGPIAIHEIPVGAKGRIVAMDGFEATIKFAGITHDYKIATRSIATAVTEIPKEGR